MASEDLMMSHYPRFIILLIFLCSGPSSWAQEPPDACAALPQVAVPETDRPTLDDVRAAGVVLPHAPDRLPWSVAQPAGETGCQGESLYYGKSPHRFVEARACVLAKLGLFRAGTPKTEASAAQSAAAGGATDPADIDREGLILAMVYANGEGVSKNLPLARRFLCDYGPGIGGDTGPEQLKKFDVLMLAGKRLDMCGNQIEFGRGVAYDCLGMEQGRRDEEIGRREHAILTAASSAEHHAFLQLREAWEEFHSAYGSMDDALCAGGTGCGPITEGDDLEFTASWLAALKAIEAGPAPALHANAADFGKLDRELNQRYHQSLEEFKDCEAGSECVAETIRAADRAWLVYREAWVRFGAVRWPSLSADQWRAWQTAEWSPMLTP